MAQATNKLQGAQAHRDCEFRDMLSRIGDKWSLLMSIPCTFRRMLTATVRRTSRDRFDGRKVRARASRP